MRALAAAFSPNGLLSRRAIAIVVTTQAALALALWWSSPFAVLPRPDEVARGFVTLWTTQGLSRELGTSFLLSLEAIALTTAIALALSYLTVLPVVRPIAAAVSKGRFLGLVGLTLIFTLMVGGGRPLKVSLLVFGMTVFFVTSMAAEIAAIPRERFDHARTLRMSGWRMVWEVVVRGTADKAFETLRQNAAVGWTMLTMVEGISRAEGGVGALLLNQSKHLHLAEVFAIQITILLVGLLQDYGIGALRRIVCPWAELGLERR